MKNFIINKNHLECLTAKLRHCYFLMSVYLFSKAIQSTGFIMCKNL